MLISSRKANFVTKAVDKLKNEGLDVDGIACHVGESRDREILFEKV